MITVLKQTYFVGILPIVLELLKYDFIIIHSEKHWIAVFILRYYL